jgi:hypothetical protein
MNRHTSWPRTVAVVGVALLVAVVGGRSPDVFADPQGFVFTPLVFPGTPTPQVGDTFLDVFESDRINNRGDVLFVTAVTREEEFGLFLLCEGEIAQIARQRLRPGRGCLRPRVPTTHHPQRRGQCGLCPPARALQFS